MTEYHGQVEAIVWTMPGMEFIASSDDVVGNVLETDMKPGNIRLWSKGEVEESPEKSETPMPVAFGPVLAFMKTSYEDARAEYFDMLEAHIGDLLSGCPLSLIHI